MAVSTSSYFGNGIVGAPQIGADTDVYEAHATPRFAIGTKMERQDGNVYRYCHFGADTNRGVLVSTDQSESSLVDTDNAVIAPVATYQMPDEQSGVYPGAIGSRYVVMTLASTTADQYAGAYFMTTDDTGEGYTFRVISNTATDTPASGLIRLKLDKPLQVALDTTTDVCIQGSPYANLELANAATDDIVAGVTVRTMDVSAASYGWIQTKGIVGVLDDGGVTIGHILTLSDGVDGAVQNQDAYTEPIVGYACIAGDSTGHSAIKLMLE